MNPTFISTYFNNIGQKCLSASKVIHALIRNSAKNAFAAFFALNEVAERTFVSEQFQIGVSNLVRATLDLSVDFRYLSEVSRNVIGSLKVYFFVLIELKVVDEQALVAITTPLLFVFLSILAMHKESYVQ